MIQDLRKIEEINYKKTTKHQIEKYYNDFTSNETSDEFFESLLKLLNKKKTLKKIKEITQIFEDIDMKDFTKIKSHVEICIGFMTAILIKSLYENSINNEEKSTISNEYAIINTILTNWNSLIIWYEWDKKIILEKYIKNDWGDLFRDSLLILVEDKKLKMEKISTIVNNVYKTHKYYIHSFLNTSAKYNLQISFDKFYIYERQDNEIYAIGCHHSLTFAIFKENNKSNSIFKTKIKSTLIENLCNNWVYLDQNLLALNYEELLKHYNLKDTNIDDSYKVFNLELIKAFKLKNYSLVKTLASKLSILQHMIIIKQILNENLENKKIYLPFKIDFRGRIYFLSSITPTNNWVIRHCLHKGEYENTRRKDHIFNEIIENELKKHHNELNKIINYRFEQKDDSIKNGILWCLVSLAEINKTKLGSVVNINKFINEGIKILNKEIELKEIGEIIKANNIFKIVEEANRDVYIKRLISKDATASCYQHLVKTLGHKNIESLKICNLESKDTWYDTYEFIIKNFVKNKKIFKHISNEQFLKLFTRKPLKRPIMTDNYGVSEKTALEYFLNEIELNRYNFDQQKEIRDIFIEFFKYLGDNGEIFQHSTHKIIEYFLKNKKLKFLNDEEVDYSYYKTKKKQKETTINGKRYTSQELILTDSYDERKFKTAIRANYVQSLDACLVRWFLSLESGITIHDCFLTDYINTTHLVSKLNEGMRVTFHVLNLDSKNNTDNLFSIFIVL